MRHVRLLPWAVCVGLTFAGGALAQSSERTAAEDDVFWESVSGCTDAVEVELYIEEFGEEGRHVAEARACLETLRKAVPDTAGKKFPSTEVERLLEVCEMHFAANRLTTGVGGTAVQCYREVQSLDSANRQAVEGLQRVFGKYAAWARAALERGDAVKARGHVEKLKGLAPEAPEVAELEGAIARLKRQAAEEQAKKERKERKQAGLAPGLVFRDCEACPEMVVVPAGSFTMGSPPHEEGRGGDEGPQHRVTIPSPFAVGRHEVTRGEFSQFVKATGHGAGDFVFCRAFEDSEWKGLWGRHWRDPGNGQDEYHPVTCVNWNDAKAYVRWVSRTTGKPYRLLSEAEWEYATRAGTRTSRYWGDEVSAQCDHANGYDRGAEQELSFSWSAVPCRDGSVHTSYVGRYGENGFRLSDMLGNVLEWVEDCWHESYRRAPADGSAWTSGGNCGTRVLRGGSWYDAPKYLRSSFRFRNRTGYRDFNYGFRIARTLTP